MEEEILYKRNIEDVKSIIKHTKLDERNLTPITQVLYYHSSVPTNGLKLLELDGHILSQIKNGQTIQFKGSINEKVVLCTDEKTYDIKVADISNSLLVVPDLKFAQATSTSPLKSPKKGCSKTFLDRSLDDEEDLERTLEEKNLFGIFHEYLECREIEPRYLKLRNLLHLTEYNGPENEYTIEKELLFTYDQLLDTIQCSRLQFNQRLQLYHGIELYGFIRKLSFEYEYRVVNLMVELINENSWQKNEIERQTTIDSLDGIVPKQIAEGLFDLYTEESDIPEKFQYKVEMVSRIIAQNILQSQNKFRIDEFVDVWQEAMPDGMRVEECHLRGIAIMDEDSDPPYIKEMTEETLSLNLLERLDTLFKTKAKWTEKEIEPYLQHFATPTCSVLTILSKHTRIVQSNGKRYFLVKHA